MKKIFGTLLGIFAIVFAANAKDQPKKFNELPAVTQQFLKKHFAEKQFSYASQDTDLFDGEYKVIFADGDKIEFDRKGNWKDIECKKAPNGVPTAVIPATIKKYLDANFKGITVISIENDKDGYEVKLKTGIEVMFNKKGEFVRIDS